MSSSVANAQHLQKMDLHLGESNITFLQSIFPCLTSSQSLQELAVKCGASGVFSGCAAHTCMYSTIDSLQYSSGIAYAFSEFFPLSVVGCIGEVCVSEHHWPVFAI